MIRRETAIQDKMAEGMDIKEIASNLKTQFDTSERSIIDQYYKIVNQMARVVDEGRNELRAKLLARNDLIYKKSFKDKNYKIALDANTAQAKLGGLYTTHDKEADLPKIITIKETDFSNGLKAVPGDKPKE